MPTFSDRVIQFNKELSFTEPLPHGIQIMNPFIENKEIIHITRLFYNKYYNDTRTRKLILGINPGRLGAGATGIPFTDTKRLSEVCGIEIKSTTTHEPSSVFIYELIEKYGGPEKFYGNFHINSVCPLGFIVRNSKGNWVNCNYYDSEELFSSLYSFILTSLKAQINFGIDTDICFVLGKKNARFLKTINDRANLFKAIITFDHPRYIVQYKSNQREIFLAQYLNKLSS
jgi:hypothetical protein